MKRAKKGKDGNEMWEVVRARGHADEVGELTKGGEGKGGGEMRHQGGGMDGWYEWYGWMGGVVESVIECGNHWKGWGDGRVTEWMDGWMECLQVSSISKETWVWLKRISQRQKLGGLDSWRY